jgi:uncharacterized protein YprB with RNaseH-like and TPR domain
MRIGIFDLECSNLNADFGIILCCSIKTYGKDKITTFRADRYPEWKKDRTNDIPIMRDVLASLDDFDILIAHNGQYFDKGWVNAKAIKYRMNPRIAHKKFIDPCQIARRKLKIHSNSLRSLISFLGIKEQKTEVNQELWMRATLNGDKKAMDYIVDHCEKDVLALEEVYDRMRQLINKIDSVGSHSA